MAAKPKPLIIIVGETASGKSAAAVELAKKINGEIICADSWTVRREVNIGTAKPSADEQAQVPHHLLDIVDPCEDFTAAVFKRLAFETIEDITSRGKVPIMVGGTGLYIDSVIFDYGFLPAGDRNEREKFNSLTAEELVSLAHARGLDTSTVDTRNKRRVIRLIETGGSIPGRQDLRPHTLIFGLTTNLQTLKERVTKRVDTMLTRGLEQEVKDLAEQYGWGCEALKGIGYVEWKDYFSGTQSLAETQDRIISSTMNLAKKQRTWFRRNKRIQWLDDRSKIVDIATTKLNNLD